MKLASRVSGHADTDLIATASARLSMKDSLFSSTKPKNFFMGAGVDAMTAKVTRCLEIVNVECLQFTSSAEINGRMVGVIGYN